MRAIVRLCIEKMDTPICAKQARRRFLPRRERAGASAPRLWVNTAKLYVSRSTTT
jgi:hypothetical protein